MGSEGLVLVTFLGRADHKGSLLSILGKTWKIITAFSGSKDTINPKTLDHLVGLNFALEKLLEMDLAI